MTLHEIWARLGENVAIMWPQAVDFVDHWWWAILVYLALTVWADRPRVR